MLTHSRLSADSQQIVGVLPWCVQLRGAAAAGLAAGGAGEWRDSSLKQVPTVTL